MQRVTSARVCVDGVETGRIGRGLLVFLGIDRDDEEEDLRWVCQKIPQVRCFEDAAGRMNLSPLEAGGGILLISQFTLFGNLRKGSRPSFNQAALPDKARLLCAQAQAMLAAALGREVPGGLFGAYMEIEATHDGPVTLLIDSKHKDW
jgi:D-tyrosyl-tRNA(Tyr) deacylase